MPRSKKAALLDTNVLLRFLRADDPVQSPRARSLMERLDTGSEEAELEESVLAETVWMLERGFGTPRAEIAQQLSRVVALQGLRVRGRRILLAAMIRYASTRCDIVDCLLAARAQSLGTTVYTFDADFKKLGCAWEEPA